MSLEEQNNQGFRDSISTIDESGKRAFIHPKKPKGKFYTKRLILGWILLAILFGVPFIKVNDHPFFLFDVIQRKFILFGVHFWPQDTYLFAIAMISLLVGIVLFTAIFGRLWCGWTCPQTVFMEILFRPIEYLIDGNAGAQKKLCESGWTFKKIWKRLLKNVMFFVLSMLITNALLAWVIGLDEINKIATDPINEHISGFIAMMVFSGFLFFIYSWFREQVCTILCPYGRIQGVLLDVNSIIVSYDYVRGEPRGKTKDDEKTGDCIDCGQCVQVCPTGIDIRNGTQLECINCMACIDACDMTMDRIGKPRGLIRLASEKEISENQGFKITPRMKAYSLLLVALIAFLSILIFGRSDLETTILRTPGMLYQNQDDGTISNLYNVKIINKTVDTVDVDLELRGVEGRIKLIRGEIRINPSSIFEDVFFIFIDPQLLSQKKNDIIIDVYKDGSLIDKTEITFIGNKQ